MTKQELLDLQESLIDGRRSPFIVDNGNGVFRIYDTTNSFTATFISDAIHKAGDAFTGITVDSDGRPYMLFSY